MAFAQWTETTPATGAVAVFNLKAMLKAAGWTVESSSDGTTYNASGDQITSGASGAAGMANNDAWFRISNPDGVEYVLQRSTTNVSWRLKCSPADTFTGGTPGIAQVPSATDEKIIHGSGTDASPTGESMFGVDASYRHKGGADSASPYHFWSCAFPSGGGTQNHALIHEGLDAVEPTDAGPFHVVVGSTQINVSTLTAESESGSSTRSLATQAATNPTTWEVVPGCTYESTSQVAPLNCATNPITAADESIPITYIRRAALSNPGWKGVGTMMRWLGTARTNGDTLTISTTRDRVVFGDISLPWQGTVPVL